MPISSEGGFVEYKDYFGYKVGRDGRVLDAAGKERALFKTKKGYLIVSLKIDGRYISKAQHRVIAECWIPNPLNLSDVDHINGVRDDNRVENLRWLSHGDNIRHSYNSGRRNVKGSRNANSIYTEDEIRRLCEWFQATGRYPKEASEVLGMRFSTCGSVRRRQQWTEVSKDYTWPQRSETRRKRRRLQVEPKREAP